MMIGLVSVCSLHKSDTLQLTLRIFDIRTHCALDLASYCRFGQLHSAISGQLIQSCSHTPIHSSLPRNSDNALPLIVFVL